MRRFASLRRQADFLALRRRGRRMSTTSLTFYLADAAAAGDSRPHVGITVSKPIGKAVVRNKLRRRLAAIVHETLRSGDALSLVIVARPAAAGQAYAALCAEVEWALGRSRTA